MASGSRQTLTLIDIADDMALGGFAHDVMRFAAIRHFKPVREKGVIHTSTGPRVHCRYFVPNGRLSDSQLQHHVCQFAAILNRTEQVLNRQTKREVD